MVGVRMTRRRRAIVASISALATAIVASSVVAGQFRSPDPEAFHVGLATGEIARVADIAAGDGLPGRGVFVQATDTGQICLWDAPSASSQQRQGGCNSVDDPLGGSALSASLAYDGGPAVEDVRDARLIGLASRAVACHRPSAHERWHPARDAAEESDARVGRVPGVRLPLQEVGPSGRRRPYRGDCENSDGRRDRETVDGHRRLTSRTSRGGLDSPRDGRART